MLKSVSEEVPITDIGNMINFEFTLWGTPGFAMWEKETFRE